MYLKSNRAENDRTLTVRRYRMTLGKGITYTKACDNERHIYREYFMETAGVRYLRTSC